MRAVETRSAGRTRTSSGTAGGLFKFDRRRPLEALTRLPNLSQITLRSNRARRALLHGGTDEPGDYSSAADWLFRSDDAGESWIASLDPRLTLRIGAADCRRYASILET